VITALLVALCAVENWSGGRQHEMGPEGETERKALQ